MSTKANTSILTEQELIELKSYLPRGSYTKIAKNAGVSRETVKQVLCGNWYNADVYVETLKIAEQEKKRRNTLAQKIMSVVRS
jgi:predicted DNA-binding protein YlxM (UPF0122 family)